VTGEPSLRTIRTADLDLAAALLRRGRLVAFPTETVYGLGADGLSPAAVRSVFAAKGRPADNPLILHVAAPEDAPRFGVFGPAAADLAARFWPGPLTLVVPARPGAVPAEVRAGLDTVALRCPGHDVARALIRLAGGPVAAPSANRSGRPSATSAEAVLEDLDGRIHAVVDGGPCRHGVESTVVSCAGAAVSLLRLGAVAPERLGLPAAVAVEGAARSPGTRHRHYAPGVPLHLCADLAAGLGGHPGAAVLCSARAAERLGLRSGPGVHVWAASAEGRASEVFAALRALERSGCPCILAEPLPRRGLDAATMDRLERAAHGSAGGGYSGQPAHIRAGGGRSPVQAEE
jgi:L-threonylcarbamoyladenylate synthase